MQLSSTSHGRVVGMYHSYCNCQLFYSIRIHDSVLGPVFGISELLCLRWNSGICDQKVSAITFIAHSVKFYFCL